jgi:4-amino-4-deoxy-L-arabinose transferase-like glycosyltransferase
MTEPTAPTETAEPAEPTEPVEPTANEATEDPPLVPRGNPPRPSRALVVVLGLVTPFLLMTMDVHSAFSVPIGFLGIVVAAWGVLDLAGTFDDLPEGSTSFGRVGVRLVELAASLLLFVLAVRLAVLGSLPLPRLSAAVLVSAGLVAVVVSAFRVLVRLGAVDETRPLLRRWGFWLLLLSVVLYVPLLGSYSLSDPWEAHYGEVAREMLARDDWISPWWAQEGWFWSKPVLDMWLQALAFSLFGVRFEPDQMLAAAADGRVPAPEWAARLPVALLAILATYALYRAVAQRFGGRAGFLGGIVLVSVPYWYLLAHQSMTDMPYVAPLSVAIALALLGLGTGPERQVRTFGLRVGGRTLGLSVRHVVLGLVLAIVLPQVLYLLSRHLTLQLSAPPYGFRFHLDEFFSGSPGNCGLPGNEACPTHPSEPVDATFQPALAALLWSACLAFFVWLNRGERRLQRWYFLAAWTFTAVAAMAKGAPGLVLPLATVLVAIAAARRFRDLTRLELVGFALLFACVCLPWYAQMYARHGSPFTDRLLFHDMYKRAFVHVHDTNAGDNLSFRYYVWQLGYGLFPWTGLAVAGLVFWQRDGNEAENPKAEAGGLLVLWFAIAFGMFTISLTKYHHYVLPCVPPIAMLTGIVLDRALPATEGGPKRLATYVGAMGLAALLLSYGALRVLGGSLFGSVPLPSSSPWVGSFCLVAGIGLLVVAVLRSPFSRQESSGSLDGVLLSCAGLASAGALVLTARDLFSPDDKEGALRLMHLVSYNYKRPWPDSLDFSNTIAAATLAFVVASCLMALARMRPHAVVLLLSLGVWVAAWGIDVYFVRTAPHWGQRETILEYYRRRARPEEPLVAFQMNWKGENFYTGNRIPAFVSTGAAFRKWLDEQRNVGVRVLFFTTEHSRESGLKSELGKIKRFEKLTSKALNNKFFLARVEL